MSRLVVVVLAILGCCSASTISKKTCKTFLKDSKFDSSVLDGAWTVVYFWPFSTHDLEAIFHYRALSPEEVTAYEKEMSSSYPAVSWEKVKYGVTLYRKNEGTSFILEILDDAGNVNMIPSGELYNSLKKSQNLKTTRYAYKRTGEYVAVKFCEYSGEDAYLMHKGTEHDTAEVEIVASAIGTTVTNSPGAVAVYLRP